MSYIFKYSVRSDTVAAEMEDQVPTEEKERRNQALLKILSKFGKGFCFFKVV